jgi:drug/metabolite transporter (DMT)-like permease
VALNFVGSGLLLLPAVAIWGVFRLNGYQFVLVLTLSVIQMAIPYLLFSWALQRVEAHRAALIVLLETVLNPLWTYLIVHEPVPEPTLIGGPLILLSVVGWLLLTWRRQTLTRRRRGASVTAPLPQRSSTKL